MSGAESSRAAGKRRRGPVPRPRGEPGSPAQFQRDERTIMYQEAERVPIIRTRRFRDHTLLMFEMDLMIMGPLTTPIDMRDLRRADILERDDPPRWAGFVVGPQVMPPQGTAAAEVVMGSVPTHRQRPVFRCDSPPPPPKVPTERADTRSTHTRVFMPSDGQVSRPKQGVEDAGPEMTGRWYEVPDDIPSH
ncbi:hypothetical protein R6Q57_010969 [Mikania cordata]